MHQPGTRNQEPATCYKLLATSYRIHSHLAGFERGESLLDRDRLRLAGTHGPDEVRDVAIGGLCEVSTLVVEEVAVPDLRQRLDALLLLVSLHEIRPRRVLEPADGVVHPHTAPVAQHLERVDVGVL